MMMVSSTITNTMSIFNVNQASLGFHLYTPLSPLSVSRNQKARAADVLQLEGARTKW